MKKESSNISKAAAKRAIIIAAALVAGMLSACGGSSSGTTPPANPPSASGLRTYFGGAVSGAYGASSFSDSEILSAYTVDDVNHTFAQSIYTFGAGNQQGPQLDYSGSLSSMPAGLAGIGISYSNAQYGTSASSGTGVSYNPALDGGWIYELPNQAGGLIGLKNLPFVPAVAAVNCPSSSQPNPYNFVSIPTYIGPNKATSGGGIANWDPQVDTAYGSVQVSTKGSTITFGSIAQYTASGKKLSSYQDLDGNPTAINSIEGACSSTFYGNTISVPANADIGTPGTGETINIPAIVGIGSSGLLLENNGETSNLVSNASASGYQPFLGSGTGAMGLPKPGSAVDPKSLGVAQLFGVIYGGGTGKSDWTSVASSFGLSSTPTTCPAGNFQSPLFGGDFPNNDPTKSSSGHGNCNVVIDLGVQDPSNNGLFPNARVYLASGFAGNPQASAHSYPAVAIAGQLEGKYAVFVIGVDTTGTPVQAWGIYLFQSN
jgi:hypothetical protein